MAYASLFYLALCASVGPNVAPLPHLPTGPRDTIGCEPIVSGDRLRGPLTLPVGSYDPLCPDGVCPAPQGLFARLRDRVKTGPLSKLKMGGGIILSRIAAVFKRAPVVPKVMPRADGKKID